MALATPVAESAASSLPALIDQCRNRLSEARSSAEMLEARNLANMALHLAKVTHAANETHADCLRMIVRAEICMANEIDAGQERGEVARAQDGRPSISAQASGTSPVTAEDEPAPKPAPAKLEEIGVSSQRVAEWRKVRDAGEDVVEQAIQSALDEGRAPTKADINRAVTEGVGVNALRAFSGNNEYYTPGRYIEAAREVMGGIDLDPASCAMAQETVKAGAYFSQEDDGLTKQWKGRVWMNPPYAAGLIDKFIDKLLDEHEARNVKEAIVLVDNRTDTGWFHKLVSGCARLCFTRGRINFYNEKTDSSSPANGSAIFYFGERPEAFETVFSRFGFGGPITFVKGQFSD